MQGVHSGSHPGHYFQDFQEVFFRDHTGGVVAPVAAVALEKAFQRGMMAHHFGARVAELFGPLFQIIVGQNATKINKTMISPAWLKRRE